MNEPAKFNNVVSFLWSIADLLNGAFQKSEFQKIILPFTVLRRLDYALELAVNHPAVRNYDDGAEDRLAIRCVQGGQAICQPRDAVCLAATRAVQN